jgi:hypothetical protein
MGEVEENGWDAIREAVVAQASGELTAGATHARIVAIAQRSGLELDARVARLLERLDAQARAQQSRRESFHRLNNAIASVRANLDFLALAFEGEAAAAPFLVDATPEERANVLQALHYALESSERLVAMTHAADDGAG